MYNTRWTILVLLFGLMLASAPVVGQGLQTGVITGTVTTPDGLSLPGATVTVASPALQGTRTAATDVNGNYVIRGLPPGDYTVTVEMNGMASRTEHTARRARAHDHARCGDGHRLRAGERAGHRRLLAGRDEHRHRRELQEGRDQRAARGPLAAARCRVGPEPDRQHAKHRPAPIAGAFAFDNVFLVNGVDINDNIFGNANNLYIEDAVEETQVLTSGISAEYGRFSGGVVNIVTKRGGNEFSGSYRRT